MLLLMLKEACIEDFIIFVNKDTNIDSKIRGQSFLLEGELPPLAPPLMANNLNFFYFSNLKIFGL